MLQKWSNGGQTEISALKQRSNGIKNGQMMCSNSLHSFEVKSNIENVVIEIKTTESIKVTTQSYNHHIRQLKNHMAILDDVYGNVAYGNLVYLILGYNSPTIRNYMPEYLITFSYRRESLGDICSTLLKQNAASLQFGGDDDNA